VRYGMDSASCNSSIISDTSSVCEMRDIAGGAEVRQAGSGGDILSLSHVGVWETRGAPYFGGIGPIAPANASGDSLAQAVGALDGDGVHPVAPWADSETGPDSSIFAYSRDLDPVAAELNGPVLGIRAPAPEEVPALTEDAGAASPYARAIPCVKEAKGVVAAGQAE